MAVQKWQMFIPRVDLIFTDSLVSGSQMNQQEVLTSAIVIKNKEEVSSEGLLLPFSELILGEQGRNYLYALNDTEHSRYTK